MATTNTGSSTSDEDVLTAHLVVEQLEQESRRKRKRTKRRSWVRPWIFRCPEYGVNANLLQELAQEDLPTYTSFLRMDIGHFHEILEFITPSIRKADTNMKEAIIPGERLAVTMRYMASGSSTSYVTVTAQLLHIPGLKSYFPYLRRYMSSMINWWQVFYVAGAIWGAHTSAKASNTLGTVIGVGPWSSFLGGILMIYGSRLAGGCTSGHGLSGMGLLALLSFVAVPAMFAGGISTAFLMKYVFDVGM